MNIEIVLTPAAGPIDDPLHGFVCGLPPGESVTVRAQVRDARDLLWRSDSTLSAGHDGVALMDVDQLIASLTPSPKAVRRPFGPALPGRGAPARPLVPGLPGRASLRARH